MADNGPKVPPPFDVRTIAELVGLMSQHDLSEIDLREGTVRIRLRRGVQPALVSAAPMMSVPAVSAAAAAAAADKPKSGKQLLEIKSQTPGTFYAAPSPGAESFVRVGSRVTPTTAVCIIEAMKILNEITADCTGAIVEVCVENQQPVEFGQVLFRVDPG